MSYVNPLLDAWASGRPTYGIWCALPSSVSMEMVAGIGFDYACVDMQHGAIDYTTALPMFQAARAGGVTPITRVPANDAGLIGKVLDAGAAGVVVPLVNTAEEAARAVAACRYPPVGQRSFGPIRASMITGNRDPQDLQKVACIVMVETGEGLENVDEIAAVEGLDAIYVGPSDLAIALGVPTGYERPEPVHVEAIERIRTACERHGVTAGIQCDSGPMAARRIEQGFGMVTVGNEGGFMRKLAKQELDTAKAGTTA